MRPGPALPSGRPSEGRSRWLVLVVVVAVLLVSIIVLAIFAAH